MPSCRSITTSAVFFALSSNMVSPYLHLLSGGYNTFAASAKE
ncbi:hypothetical protein [Klebsiella pneumoniae IS43]|uniref:Uncharacterized protein n=1 Tax=Klebsiella pneumoniae IS43 TaxID=1432552 RepID=W1DPQ8_KLEPN|nr:hypothetical protein [Klebsiella pneumoniae IS43]CDL62975.1 hypothetical protein [Klebsiella pneumoniae IS39]